MKIKTGLTYKDGSPVFIGETIVITNINREEDYTQFSMFFDEKRIDRFTVEFIKHEKYHGFRFVLKLFKGDHQLTVGERFEPIETPIEDMSESQQQRYLKPYIEKANSNNYRFLDLLQQSEFEKLEENAS